MKTPTAVMISARRSAIGRIGGLHRLRRLEDLAVPVLLAALADAGCERHRVEGLILGNVTAGGNSARVVGLAGGLQETSFAITVDAQCGSGLTAVISAFHRVAMGEAEVLVAGGAESLSSAPWRIARPKSPYQMPHFISVEPHAADANGDALAFEASEVLARRLGISRQSQDEYAAQSHLSAMRARERRQFIGEIVGIRATPEEMRDQCHPDADLAELADLSPFNADDGTLTPGNTSAMADGAAFTVVVSGRVWKELGMPRGLTLQRSLSCGVPSGEAASAGLAALQGALQLRAGKPAPDVTYLAAIEMSEASAVESIAVTRALGLNSGVLNGGGGALVRGHPLGAASAVSVARLFTRLCRTEKSTDRLGAVAQAAIGGLGTAAIFEPVG